MPVAPRVLASISCSSGGGGGGGGTGGGPGGGTWSSPVYFHPAGGFPIVVSDIRTAVDSTGGAMLFWSAVYVGTTVTTEYQHSRYAAASGWSAPVPFAPTVPIGAMPEMGMQGDGEAVLAWYAWDPSGIGSVYVARTAPGSGFPADPAVLTTVDSVPSGLRLHVRESGHAVLGWTKNNAGGGGPLSAWAAVYAPGAGWSAAAPVEQATSAVASGSLRVAADGSGGALAVWKEEDAGAPGIWASRYVAGSGWGRRSFSTRQPTPPRSPTSRRRRMGGRSRRGCRRTPTVSSSRSTHAASIPIPAGRRRSRSCPRRPRRATRFHTPASR